MKYPPKFFYQQAMRNQKKTLRDSLKAAVKGLQPFVDPATDLLKTTDVSTWSIAFHGRGAGHDLDFMFSVSVQAIPYKFGIKINMVKTLMSVTNETTGLRKFEEKTFRAFGKADIARDNFRIKADGFILAGDLDKMHLRVTGAEAFIDVQMRALGHVLYSGGAGIMKMWDVETYQYAIPEMVTEGFITIQGEVISLSGVSWFDRQYSNLPKKSKSMLKSNPNWIWMHLSFDNHPDKISLWDTSQGTSQNEFAWATVLQPDGSHITAVVEPLISFATDRWKSPGSGKTYPLKWKVKIQDLDAYLEVRPVFENQEILATDKGDSKYIGVGYFIGKYKGETVTGFCDLGLVGDWS